MVIIFSVAISDLTKAEFRKHLRERVALGERTSIATVNPEILLAARKDQLFAKTLNSCTFRVVDGFGISLVSFLKRGKKLHRIIGRDVLDVVLELAQEFGMSIGLVGGERGIAAKACTKLSKIYPGVSFVDMTSGETVVVSQDGMVQVGKEVLKRNFSRLKPNILLTGFGALKQERFMLNALETEDSLHIVCGIGGILDVLAGKIRPVPPIFSRLGMEWLWRVLQEPSRFTRILRAVIVFPVVALFADSTTYGKK